MKDAVVIEEFKERRANTLRGFCRVRLVSGMILEDVGIHQGVDGCWVSMPSKPMIDARGAVVRDERGKIRYVNLVNFATRAKRDQLTQMILEAVLTKFPQAFD
jgi:DNA-binding cell septation regulator SpoVG